MNNNKELTLTKEVYYQDIDDMIARTSKDIEFLEAFNINFEYRIVLVNGYIVVEFTCKE